MSEAILAPTFLFRFSAPCRYRKTLWSDRGIKLDDNHVLPSFGELEGRPLFADVRAAWNETGFALDVLVVGKKQTPWCRQSRLEDSDGLQVWLDTRDAHNIHRANRFCHRFVFLPMGAGQKLNEPAAALLTINRAKQHPKSIEASLLRVKSTRRSDGYLLKAFIPSSAITGYDPRDHPRLGFSYAVIDRELGWQTFSVGTEFPFQEDPSLWGTLELTK